jgi:hypothetical protein
MRGLRPAGAPPLAPGSSGLCRVSVIARFGAAGAGAAFA